MRRLICWMMILTLLLVVSGCKSNPEPVVADANAPDDEGYYTLAQRTTGGSVMDNSNAKTLTIEKENGLTVIRIAFVLGSKLSNVDEATANTVPSYRLFGFSDPQRLVLDIDNLAFWDFERKLDIAQDDPMFFGIFKQALTDASRFRIFFQLKENVSYKIEEKGGTLSITLRPEAEAEPKPERFFVTANAPLALGEARTIGDIGLHPTLCDDLTRTLLISAPFETREEADAFRDSVLAQTQSSGLLTDKQLEIISLSGNALPQYNTALDFQNVQSLSMVRQGGVEKQLPVVMPDGLFLCTSPDGRRMLFSKLLATAQPEPEPEADAEAEAEVDDDAYADAEQLWIVETNGRKKQLTDFEFSSIQEAAFSPNGKLLAILERSSDASYLHIFDMEANQLLYNLGEEGFGDSIETFIWDTMGTAIYAVGGTEKVRLLKYDFTIPDETKRVGMVEDADVEASELGFLSGELYFSDSVEGVSTIYKIKPEGGVRSPLTSGNSFQISPDGKYMVVQEIGAIGGEDEETTNNVSLKLVNLATKEETSLLKQSNIVSMGWGFENKIYYSVGNLEQESDDRFQFTLMEYDIETQQTREVTQMLTPEIYPSLTSGIILLPYMDNSGTESIRATYLLSVD